MASRPAQQFQILRIRGCKSAVCIQTDLAPLLDPFAVVQIRLEMASFPHAGFMVTAAGADGADPASPAVRFVANFCLISECLELFLVKPFKYIAHIKFILAGKSLAEIELSLRAD